MFYKKILKKLYSDNQSILIHKLNVIESLWRSYPTILNISRNSCARKEPYLICVIRKSPNCYSVSSKILLIDLGYCVTITITVAYQLHSSCFLECFLPNIASATSESFTKIHTQSGFGCVKLLTFSEAKIIIGMLWTRLRRM